MLLKRGSRLDLNGRVTLICSGKDSLEPVVKFDTDLEVSIYRTLFCSMIGKEGNLRPLARKPKWQGHYVWMKTYE